MDIDVLDARLRRIEKHLGFVPIGSQGGHHAPPPEKAADVAYDPETAPAADVDAPGAIEDPPEGVQTA